jgi:hypothetical protein
MWGQDFILPPAFWPAFSEPPHDAGQKRAQRAPRQDEILTPLPCRTPRARLAELADRMISAP